MKKNISPVTAILAILAVAGAALGIMWYIDSRPKPPLPIGPAMGGGGASGGGNAQGGGPGARGGAPGQDAGDQKIDDAGAQKADAETKGSAAK
jgi:hypothetical protein